MNPQKIGNYIKSNPWICILFLILLIQFILISVCNIKLIDNNIDCDTGKLFVHTMKMWEHRTIFIPDWAYVSTLEIDCSSLFALPLYGLTGDIFLSYGIANIIMLAGFIWMIFYLFTDKNPLYPLFVCNLICVPYTMGMLDYFNMLFFGGSQYILKGTLPLFFIAVILWCERSTSSKKKFATYIPLIIFELLIFINAVSSGIYVLFVGLVPVILGYLLYKLFISEKLTKKAYITLSSTLLLSLVGIILNNVLMEGGRSAGMELISAYEILANVYTCIAGIWELFGGLSHSMETAVMSAEGIGILLKSVFVITFLICGLIAFIRVIRKKADLRITLLISVFIWNMFVLLSTKTSAGSETYEYRYHIIGMLPVICIAGSILVDAWTNLKPFQKKTFATVAIIAIIAVNALSFAKALDPTDEQMELKTLCSYCDELDVEYVYLYDASNDADMCRLITKDDAHYICLMSGGTTWVYDYYARYLNGPIYPDNAILVVDNRNDFGDSFEMFGYKFVKFDTVANRTLYYFAE